MIHSKRVTVIICIIFIFLTACSAKGESSTELTISAAVSLKEPLQIIKEEFERENPHMKLRFNYGGSGSLQQQISQGAPVDLFVSAAEDKFRKLVEEDLIIKELNTSFLQNELVLIVPKDNLKQISSFQDLIHNEIEYISIGIPETVPAGKYAKEVLESLGVWEKIEEKLVYAKDVRQVLSYVETGNVEAGVVYRTDALQSEKVAIIETANPSNHSPIVYPVGVINGTKYMEAAKLFYHYLLESNTLEVFKNHGFLIE